MAMYMFWIAQSETLSKHRHLIIAKGVTMHTQMFNISSHAVDTTGLHPAKKKNNSQVGSIWGAALFNFIARVVYHHSNYNGIAAIPGVL